MQSPQVTEEAIASPVSKTEDQYTEQTDTYRSHVPHKKNAPIPQQFKIGGSAQYTPMFRGPVTDVTITNIKKDNNGKWVYQVKDSVGSPVQSSGRSEPDWIPETKLRELE
ncbi:MAG: hypothetical protein Q9227_006576 [Pyrenula ochraceoflavens]